MSTRKFKNVYAVDESLNMLRPPNVTQEITDFTSNVAVTLANPKYVVNATNTAGNISILHSGEVAYRVVYVPAGGKVECDPSYIGTATTVTKVLIQGIE